MRKVAPFKPLSVKQLDEFRWSDGVISVCADFTSALITEGERDTLPVYMKAEQFARLSRAYLAWLKEQWLLHKDDWRASDGDD
jgi:hypothetical protein